MTAPAPVRPLEQIRDRARFVRLETVRLSRIRGAVILHVRRPEGWRLMRLADFPEGPALFGPMCCSPERAGFRATFHSVRVGPPVEHPLHGPWPE